MIKHKHHIIPKHMGGTDDTNNLVELTCEEHAEAHKKLYEKYGLIEDWYAWQGLAKLISKTDITREIIVRKNKERWTSNNPKWVKYRKEWLKNCVSMNGMKGKLNAHAKSYYLKKDNKEIKIVDLKDWCKQNKFKYNTFHKGITRHPNKEYKGYLLIKKELNHLTLKNS